MTENTPADAVTAAYLARRGVSAQWRAFLRALVETLDAHLDEAGRASLMHIIGRRMAESLPLRHCDTLSGLEAQVNDVLAGAEWGFCRLAVDTGARRLVITHLAAPSIGTGADAEGAWIGAVLEGLWSGWMAEQPGAAPARGAVVATPAPGETVLHYAKG
jgi:hypothetical protein